MKLNITMLVSGVMMLILVMGGAAFANGERGRDVEEVLDEIREVQGTGPGKSIGPLMGPGVGIRGFGIMGGMPMMSWGMYGRHGSGGFGAFPGAMMGGFWPFLIWRIVMWIVVLGVIGVVVWLIVRTQKQRGGTAGMQEESPLDIIKRRYARGEITREEFENLKRDLQ
jgi:uncharacterized membrane protein